MMILVDSFTFFNEKDIALKRINYLAPEVDFFIVVESSKTHSGKPKKFYFESLKKQIEPKNWKKIIYIKDEPEIISLDFTKKKKYDPTDDYWHLENRQRNQILKGLQKINKYDFVMISDVDEIPRKTELKKLCQNYKEPLVFNQKLRYYYANVEGVGKYKDWLGTALLSKEDLKTPQYTRDNRYNYKMIENMGWHYSYLGGSLQIKKKIESFAHSEYNKESIKNQIEVNIHKIKDIYQRNHEYELIKIIEDEPIKEPIHKGIFSVVIPTMWRSNESLQKQLKAFENSPYINEVIIINNDVTKTPSFLERYQKIKLQNQQKNIGVNPAWNLGVKKSKNQEVIVINDDIYFDEEDLHKLLKKINAELKSGIIITLTEDSFYQNQKSLETLEVVEYEKYNFPPKGIGEFFCLHKEDYKPIPQVLKIFFGEHFNFYKNKAIGIKGINVYGQSAKTVKEIVTNFNEEYLKEYKEFLKIIEHTNTETALDRFYSKALDKNLNIKRKKVAIYLGPTPDFNQDQTNLFGSELAAKRLAEELSKYFYVYIFGHEFSYYENNNVIYTNTNDILNHLEPEEKFEAIIMSRYIDLLTIFDLQQISKKNYFWLHDLYIGPYINGQTLQDFGKHLIKNTQHLIEKIVVLSNWQKKEVNQIYDLNENKYAIIRNAFETTNFKPGKKQEDSFIFFQSPDRGLLEILNMWPEIKKIKPNATLKVFGNTNYFTEQGLNIQEIFKEEQGLFHFGKVSNKEISQQLKKSKYWLYPLKDHECAPISSLEALATKTLPITINKTGLGEYLQNKALLISPHLKGEQRKKEFLKLIQKTNQNNYEDLLNKAYKEIKNESWVKIAKQWKQLIQPKKITIHIHWHCVHDYKQRLQELINLIKKSQLYDFAKKIYVYTDKKITTKNYDTQKITFITRTKKFKAEHPTLKKIRDFAIKNPNETILYIHSKGITTNTTQSKNWAELLNYFYIENWYELYQKVNEDFDVAGINYQIEPFPHFSGNFFFAKNNYLAKLKNNTLRGDRIYAEKWLFKNNPTYYNAFESKANHFLDEYPRHMYTDLKPTKWQYQTLNVSSGFKELENYLEPIIKKYSIETNKALDLGVDQGYSTYILSQLFQEVIGVDHFKGDDNINRVQGEDFEQKIRTKLQTQENITIINKDATKYLKETSEEFDLIHIDLSHSYQETLDAIILSFNKTNLVLVHDTQSFEEVKKACMDAADKLNLDFIEITLHNGLGILTSKK